MIKVYTNPEADLALIKKLLKEHGVVLDTDNVPAAVFELILAHDELKKVNAHLCTVKVLYKH